MAAMNSTSGWRTLSQTQCVILAGHPGSRMFPVTLDKPKALLPVANIPILTQLLTTLERLNFASAIVVTSEEFQEQITAFRDYYRGPVQVDPVVYPDSTGTADVIRNLHAEGRLASDGILVLPGELLVEVWPSIGVARGKVDEAQSGRKRNGQSAGRTTSRASN